MPAYTLISRSGPCSHTLAPPPAPVLVELPAFISSPLLAPDFAVRPVLRVGDYEVGETFCPRLYGHPGIRY